MTRVWADGVRMSVGTLTSWPVRAPGRVDRDVGRVAMLVAPAVGLMPAAVAAGVVAVLVDVVGAPPLVAAAGAIGAVALFTRGLHLDGLADTADGMAASYDQDRALAVMRTGDVGPAGTTTLVLVLLAQVGALAGLVGQFGGLVGGLGAALAAVVSRSALPLVCAGSWAAARPGGLGAVVARCVPVWAAASVALVVAAAVGGAWLLVGNGWWAGLLAALCGWAGALLLVWRVARRIGGTTGDVLGAAVEVAMLLCLVGLASWS